MKIIGRHRDRVGICITESYDEKKEGDSYRRFTATIRGWRNWKLYEGYMFEGIFEKVVEKAIEIRDLIDSNDPDIFNYEGYFL